MYFLGNISVPSARSVGVLLCTSIICSPLSALAAAHFLPNYEDHLASFKDVKLDFVNQNSQQCPGYDLDNCPSHAVCNRCAFQKKFFIASCLNGYKINSDKSACLAKSCSEINSTYSPSIPAENNCASHLITDISCYSECRAVSCSAYTLTSCPSNAVCISCPDCDTTDTRAANCSAPKLKVATCTSSAQKVNTSATACIDKDDTCPTGYFKSCNSGIDGNYTSTFTELGSECFRCKARTCSSGAWNLDYYFCNGFLKCLIPAK